eukprot:11940881-Heterocapsa_arctica.AAC.1
MLDNPALHPFPDEATAAQALAHPWDFAIDPASGAPQRRGVEARVGITEWVLDRRDREILSHARQ